MPMGSAKAMPRACREPWESAAVRPTGWPKRWASPRHSDSARLWLWLQCWLRAHAGCHSLARAWPPALPGVRLRPGRAGRERGG